MVKREQGLQSQRRLASTAGLTLGRLAYSVLYRGRPYSDFTVNVLVAAKNEAVTGDINHIKRFVSEFRYTCAATPQRKRKQYLSTPLECTGRWPLFIIVLGSWDLASSFFVL